LKAVFPGYEDKVELAVVENNEAPGAYDSVVQGVDRVVHMASPLPGSAGTDNEAGYLIPARDGIVNMLKSAKKSASVKRVVMTASSTAVVDSKVPINVPYVPRWKP
jgi:nucleoside-diphosphate-sugar epimerase